MFSDFGNDMLITACLVALVVFFAGHIAGNKENNLALRITRFASMAVFMLVMAAFGILMAAYVTSDFSLQNVYENSHTDKPLFYKIAAVWGNHEGSMLLWTLVASFFAFLFALFPPKLSPRFLARVLGTQHLLIVGFLLFIFFTSNPFTPLFPVPLQGLGMNPLLQDPALSFHPPILYLGYVGFSLAFSYAVAGLLTGEIDKGFARGLRGWVLLAWSALTLGIALGSWWAYYELGWGGWWFWDPVENASLIPWLAGTALLHSLLVLEKRGTLKTWVVLLSLMTFTLALIGTFLVRSGVITSVHAFVLDPGRGIFVLLLIGLSAGYGLVLFALRAPGMMVQSSFTLVSRESLLILNNVFLTAACATVLIGTLYPLIIEITMHAPLSVGPPYYESSFMPLMMPLLLLMGFAPYSLWGQDSFKRLWPQLNTIFLITLAFMVLLFALFQEQALRFYLGMFFAAWLAFTTLADFWRHKRLQPMHLAHCGLAIMLFGAVATSHLSAETSALMKPDAVMQLGKRSFRFVAIHDVQGPNYIAERAHFIMTEAGGGTADLYPSRRFYPVQQKMLAKVAIATNGFEDIYLVLGEPQKDDAGNAKGWSVRAATHPLVPWLWIGCAIMACGGAFSIFRLKNPNVFE